MQVSGDAENVVKRVNRDRDLDLSQDHLNLLLALSFAVTKSMIRRMIGIRETAAVELALGSLL